MNILIGQFKEVSRYERLDPETGQRRVDKSYRVHVTYPDGTVIPETIYFPRDPEGRYREPSLQKDETYAFPVSVRPTKDGRKVSYTASLDRMPFDAPKAQPKT